MCPPHQRNKLILLIFFNGGALFLSDKRLHSSHYYSFSPFINLVFTPTPPRLKKIRVGTKIKILAPVTKIKAHNEFPFHYVCPIFYRVETPALHPQALDTF